ncbi:TrmH family RNA methyltransferase [Chryseotalea sanaruensis]|uniref:TrmH family RNA methyltransferase n=2 Tax=Chryseotalea sanaruensis TaxID=2482724 RepID=A0A401U8D6_9BACT|nr:TrmH family RNA methyltransferase [Chryseotalea sanaruensis]
MEPIRKLSMEELGRVSAQEYKARTQPSLVVVLDNVRSLHNVGSLFRTSDAFAVSHLYLTGITGTPPHREIHKSALGATESVPWSYHENVGEIVAQLKKEGYEAVVVEQTTGSQSLETFIPSAEKKYCLIFGNEVDGVSDEVLKMATIALEIPQSGTKHSLNVSVCAGIILWHFYRQLAL